ncbi:cpeS-like family protein [Microcystis aeruginosa TAIHU98]|uniref:Chromophore lyase CpcS/CpeS n=1 Tax=Microcystis aeruginosa TAIHU98 TaxID=1134457 RepID=L7E4T5_MICAE|nr:phycobiliprotein lyase [Microcystis aeruginosa]ELP54475.1 cpeS-like family protein [Microcystis aeruginosa TAIHU98]
MNTEVFQQFFAYCVGSWQTERTYHYLAAQEVERSRTEFLIQPLTREIKQKVLTDNHYADIADLETIPGFNLGFYTISEKGEEVRQNLNLLFVVKTENNGYLEGDYLRDRAYEEARPIISAFRFDSTTRELLMTTNYTRSVSVDSITLINPDLRIRKIINYQRPQEGEPLEKVLLVGFGVECKVS